MHAAQYTTTPISWALARKEAGGPRPVDLDQRSQRQTAHPATVAHLGLLPQQAGRWSRSALSCADTVEAGRGSKLDGLAQLVADQRKKLAQRIK